MGNYIKDQKPAEDSFLPFTGLEEIDSLPTGDIYVPLQEWKVRRQELLKRNGRLGVLLSNTDDISELKEDLERLDLVVLEFPKMADGRAFTQARLLRDRYGFKNEIRATGDVLRDQIFYMHRCGFNGFELRDDQETNSALKGFSEMTITYQPATDTDLPIWRR